MDTFSNPRKTQAKTLERMDFCTQLASQWMLEEVKKSRENNLVVSPVSLNLLLNMVAAGLKGSALEYTLGYLGSENIDAINSKSREMMAVAAAVGSTKDGHDDGGPMLAMVNGAWADQRFPLKPLYEEKILKGIFNCESKTVDFATQAAEVRDKVNAWAEAVSRGLIKNFLDPGTPSPNTALILANGLYFKGTWDHDYRFVKERTERKDFYLLNGYTISVPFMTSSKKYPCGSFDGFKVLNIPYEKGKCERYFSMYFFLPDERHGLQNLLEKLINSNPETYFRLPKVVLDKFWIPKFKFSYKFEVSEAMRDTGAPFSFAENPTDLSEMLHIPEGARLPPTSIIQKACIEIDEKGTEAAAITALLISFDGFKVLQIPYENGKRKQDFSIHFFLPDERWGLQNLLEKLLNSNPQTYFYLSEALLDKFWIPKFKFSYKFEVSNAMNYTGTPFSFAENPVDLSNMLHIPEGAQLPPAVIIQKARIEIDEKGIEAAAVTALTPLADFHTTIHKDQISLPIILLYL
ncbi:hypothetical protein RHGRI_016197 [Rhododendron griersonianum]|uniref:Serpin domain-containing protein n=1 Tax=Rhododendron griersonianum TaxID=479676 RepID=A0AAV6JRE7_9ERIC|nr:hypothetical protein RHGRI_016197 [Rhododendron griersonianum]